MNGVDWLEIGRQVAILITAAAGGGLVFKAVQWIKDKLDWHGDRAEALALVSSFLVALSGMIAAGELGLADLNESNLSNIVIVLAISAWKFHQRMKRQQEERIGHWVNQQQEPGD